jgi:hypothetical protein
VPTIDIPISASVQDAFDLPSCDVLQLPTPKPLKIQLPSGGSMNALVDVSKGIPNDCAMTFNLLLQLQPLLVALECPMRVLKLLKPLVDIVKGLPVPPVQAVEEFAEAAVELAPCFLSLLGIPEFVKDILCLIRAVLNCLLSQIRAVRDLMEGLELRLAEADGNPDLLATLQCAQENAKASAGNVASAIDPLAGVMALVSAIMSIAGMSLDIQLQAPSGPPGDLEALDAVILTLQTAVDAIDTATGGACA